MFSKIRISLVVALLLSLLTFISVLAKGDFNFITVTGMDLNESVRITDPALTEDFFAFANFFEDRTETPADPGSGYEITRFYMDGKREIAFDQLHYYPETGFVFYDGIVNGDSEYDDEWYTAAPNIENALQVSLLTQTQAVDPLPQSQPVIQAVGQNTAPISQNQFMITIAIVAGMILTLLLAYRLRKPVIH